MFKVDDFLKDYISDVKTAFPEFASIIDSNYDLSKLDPSVECKFFEENLRPHIMKIMQKDDSLFEEPIQILRGVDMSSNWKSLPDETKENIWKYVRMSVAFSFLGGDPADQLKSVIDLFKGFWSQQTGRDADEIDGVLNDENTKSSITELLEVFSNSKIAALITEMVETIDPSSLGLEDIDLTDLSKLTDMLKNPESPILKKAMGIITKFIEEKIKKGVVTKEELVAEIEGFKARITGSFGKLIKETLIGAPTDGRQTHSADTLMSNHPDARRARMLARLQRKQRERTDGKK